MTFSPYTQYTSFINLHIVIFSTNVSCKRVIPRHSFTSSPEEQSFYSIILVLGAKVDVKNLVILFYVLTNVLMIVMMMITGACLIHHPWLKL